MKIKYLAFVIFGISCTAVFSSIAAQPENTIKSCTSLLPAGHVFNMSISAAINTKSEALDFDGDFSVADGSGASPASFSQEQVKPFIDCVIGLIE